MAFSFCSRRLCLPFCWRRSRSGTLTSDEEWLGLSILTYFYLLLRKWGRCLISTCICPISRRQVSKIDQGFRASTFLPLFALRCDFSSSVWVRKKGRREGCENELEWWCRKKYARETATANFRGKKKGKGDRKAIYDDQPRLSLRLMPDMENIPAHFTLELLIMGN